ncbi:hypothetical protein RYH73_22055 [Olivibacter sp. CPCC 100613]|uniref:hypothetical protein n=1 Tax=Olivibacter sp. CPCC 100613 TaxID=3079931 RepID=UPI002FFB076D
MKTFITKLSLSLISISFFFSACNQTTESKKHANWADSSFRSDTTGVDTTHVTTEGCFLGLADVSSKDSTFISLSILDNKVTGKYSWIPFEKDRRTGTLIGTKQGDTLDVVWRFTQEGTQDTLRTVFLLQNDQLKQKPFSINQETGRQFTDDKSAFSISYQKTDCSALQ